MKKFRFKILFTALALVLMLVAVFAITTFGTSSSTTVTFKQGDVSYNKMVAEGGSITLPTPESKVGGTVYGWFDKDGNFYNCGETISPSKDLILYCADGGEIALSGSFPLSISKGYSYIKLKSNITINQTINLNDGILYIDLNGNNFALNTDGDGFVGQNAGLIIANSSTKTATLKHVASGEVEFSLNSLVSLSPSKKTDALTFVIGENASVNANMNLINVAKNIDTVDGALNVDIYGMLESGKFIRSSGLSNASFTIHDTASIKANCEYLFEDLGSANNVLTFEILGGNLDLSKPTSYASDYARYKVLVSGGTYTTNISSFFPYKNYIFKASGDKYVFDKCNHEGTLIESATDCVTPVTLKHLCQYCNTVFTKNYSDGVGHSYMPVLSQDIVNTPEETKPGVYTLKCTRCGETDDRYTYPDPSTVYVSVGYIWEGKEVYKRVPAIDLFSIDGTEVKSFSADALMHETTDSSGNVTATSVAQKDVFYVEIPLGVTTIFGDYRNENGGTPTGVFLRNDHLKIIELPVSIETIEQYSFSSMPSLENVIGLEYITNSIGKYAFAQDADSNFFVEHLVLNARTIGEYAFQNTRMVSLTYGKNVGTISKGAFSVSDGVESALCEVFVEGCLLNEVTVSVACQNARKSHAGGHQYDDQKIVYLDHAFSTLPVDATCIEYGYDLFTCARCSISEKRNIGTTYANHAYEPYYKAPTCQTYGVEGEKCTVCEYIFVHNNTKKDPNTHVYTAKEVKFVDKKYGGLSFCTDPYYTLGQCICGAIEADIPANRSETVFPPAGSDHAWVEKVIKEANCGVWGLSELTCKECGVFQSVPAEPVGKHTWVKTPVSAPTCSSGEKGIYTCSVCNKTENYSEPTPNPNNHTKFEGDIGEVVIEPTIYANGQRKYICSGCNTEFYESIAKLPMPEEEYKAPVSLFGFIKLNFLDSIDSVKNATTNVRTFLSVLISTVVAILLLLVIGGGVLAIVFTFTSKKNKAKGYKFRFNTTKKGKSKSTLSVEEQLAAMNLSEELPPEIPVSQNGVIDEEAAWTAYVDAINKDYQETVELSLKAEEEAKSNADEDTEVENAMSDTGAWHAYVDAINKDYEETMEISLKAEEEDDFSLDDIMQDTVFDLSVPSLQELEEQEELARQEAEEIAQTSEQPKKPKKSKKKSKKSKEATEEPDDESFTLGEGEPSYEESFDLGGEEALEPFEPQASEDKDE